MSTTGGRKKLDSLDESRMDSGIDSFRSMYKSDEGRDVSSEFGGASLDKCVSADERLDSAYDSAPDSAPMDSLVDKVQVFTISAVETDTPPQEEENPLTAFTEDGDTILHLAIIHEDEQFAQQLIDFFPTEVLDIQNNLYQSPLHLAVYLEQLEVVRGLVERGASLQLQDRDGNTALHLACQYGYAQSLDYMIQELTPNKLAPLMQTHNWRGLACLHLAALYGQHEVLKLLRRKGVELNVQDGTSGKTPLHVAVDLHDVSLVKLLLSWGVNVDAAMFNGCTALHLAVGRQDAAIAHLLCQSGADKMLRNMEDETPLDLADGNDDILALFPFDDIHISGRSVVGVNY